MLREFGESALAATRRVRLRPAPEDLVLERTLHLPRAEDLFHLAHDQFEHADLALEDLEHVGLERAAAHQVHDAHRVRLPQSVDAADALLEPHGVPGQVVVHDDARELQVAALAAGLGRDQHLFVMTEVVERLLLLTPAHLTVEQRHAEAGLTERGCDGFLSGAELREDDRLLALQFLDRADERAQFAGVARERASALGELLHTLGVQPVGILGQLLERAHRRTPRRAHLLLQHHEREVVRTPGPAVVAVHRVGDEIADLPVQQALGRRLRHPHGLDFARRERERRVGATGADHDALQEASEARCIARSALVVPGQEVAAELRERPHGARPHERDQVVELTQVVLHRRRREQQQIARIEFVQELPPEREVIA